MELLWDIWLFLHSNQLSEPHEFLGVLAAVSLDRFDSLPHHARLLKHTCPHNDSETEQFQQKLRSTTYVTTGLEINNYAYSQNLIFNTPPTLYLTAAGVLRESPFLHCCRADVLALDDDLAFEHLAAHDFDFAHESSLGFLRLDIGANFV